MSEETSALLNVLFSAEERIEIESNLNFNEYIWKIGTLKSDELNKEPNKLKDEKANILSQTQDLAVTNYKTLIQTAECSRNLFEGFNFIETKLDSLLENLPTFEQNCHLFINNTSEINTLRRLNSLTLTRCGQLLEILELPQLMESFIKDGLYEDALELAAYVRRLYAKQPDIPIFKNILEEINKAWLIMLHHLLGQLRQDIQLSRCLQIVSYLRRMEVFSEAELRLKFLHTREVCLKQALNGIEDTNANHHLNKTVEVTRVHLFNIITQYKAIFNDDEHSPLSALNRNQHINQNLIFFSWIRNKIEEFLVTLERDLNREITSIDSILGQCMYFGLSFSKVGCDFRPSMVSIFNKAIARHFGNAIQNATRNFERNIERFTLINKNYPTVPWKNKSTDPIQPPENLLEFYPLAEYLNQILIAFNELRLCAPVAIIHDIIVYLEESLLIVSKAILTLYGQEQQAFTANSKDAFIRLCLCFVDDLVPYVQKCINIIYPPNYVASHISFSVQNLQCEGIITINKSRITEALQHLLPTKIQPQFNTQPAEVKQESVEDKKNASNEIVNQGNSVESNELVEKS